MAGYDYAPELCQLHRYVFVGAVVLYNQHDQHRSFQVWSVNTGTFIYNSKIGQPIMIM